MLQAMTISDVEFHSESPDEADPEADFMELVLAEWAAWAWCNSDAQGYPQAGNIWGLWEPVAHRWVINLTDDQFVLVDKAVARKPWRPHRKMIFVEFWLHEPQRIKAQRLGFSRRSYKRRLGELFKEMYNDLMPGIEQWRPPGR